MSQLDKNEAALLQMPLENWIKTKSSLASSQGIPVASVDWKQVIETSKNLEIPLQDSGRIFAEQLKAEQMLVHRRIAESLQNQATKLKMSLEQWKNKKQTLINSVLNRGITQDMINWDQVVDLASILNSVDQAFQITIDELLIAREKLAQPKPKPKNQPVTLTKPTKPSSTFDMRNLQKSLEEIEKVHQTIVKPTTTINKPIPIPSRHVDMLVEDEEKKQPQEQQYENVNEIAQAIEYMEALKAQMKPLLPPDAKMENPGFVPFEDSQCHYPWFSIQQVHQDRSMNTWTDAKDKNICVQECGGEGDCMFYVLGFAISQCFTNINPTTFTTRENYFSMIGTRYITADSFSIDTHEQIQTLYNYILVSQREKTLTGLPPSSWDPHIFPDFETIDNDDPSKSFSRPKNPVLYNFLFNDASPSLHVIEPLVSAKTSIGRLEGRARSFKWVPIAESKSFKDAPFLAINHNILNLLKIVIQTPGMFFEGDTTVLNVISRSPKSLFYKNNIGFVILQATQKTGQRLLPDTANFVIILLNVQGAHWQAIGFPPGPDVQPFINAKNPNYVNDPHVAFSIVAVDILNKFQNDWKFIDMQHLV